MGWTRVVFVALVGLVCVAETALANPPADAKAAHGAQIYSELCASCHGRYGRGDGLLAPSLSHMPPDLTDPKWLAGRSDRDIANGLASASHGPMSVAGVLKPEAMVDAVAYMAST